MIVLKHDFQLTIKEIEIYTNYVQYIINGVLKQGNSFKTTNTLTHESGKRYAEKREKYSLIRRRSG